MRAPSFDPRRLSVAQFAADAGELDGEWPVSELRRLADSECPPNAGAPAEPPRRVRWRAVGSTRAVGGEAQVWLSLTASATVALQCQRCLQPMDEAVHVDRHFRFVGDEAAAAALDEEIEDEVLELPRALDLRELVEDEMLLALPLVPRHAQCPAPLPRAFGDVEEVEQAEQAAHPFAALAALRKDGPDDVH
jgi:uncharacterized protein